MLWRDEGFVSIEYWEIRLQFKDIKREKRVESWKSLIVEKERIFFKY